MRQPDREEFFKAMIKEVVAHKKMQTLENHKNSRQILKTWTQYGR